MKSVTAKKTFRSKAVEPLAWTGNYAIRILAIQAIFLLTIAPLSRATAKTVYVDGAHGTDSATCGASAGTGACASLAKAQLLVQGFPGSTVKIAGNQTYYLLQSPTNPGTLNFTSADSGLSGLVTTWEANPGTGTPIISGGIRLNSSIATASHTGNLYQFQFKSTANILPFEYLFYTPPGATDWQRRLRARLESSSSSSVGFYMSGIGTCSASNWPAGAGSVPTLTPAYCNLGTFMRVINTVAPVNNCPSMEDSNSGAQKCMDRFQYDPNDSAIAALVSGSPYTTNLNGTYAGGGTGAGFGGANGSPAGPCVPTTGSQFPEGDIELTLFDAWTVDVMRIACIDTTGHFIYLTNATKIPSAMTTVYNYFGPTVNHRYIIENARTAFFTAQANGQTGLWYLDKSTTPWTLDYIANSGENPFSDPIVIPQLGSSFPASTSDPVGGSLLSATGLSYVTFSGIYFEVDNNTPLATNYTTGVGGGFNNDDNGESAVPQVIDCESCQFVTFNGITVRHTSGTGIRTASPPSTITCNSTSPCVQIENSIFYDIGDDGIHIGHAPNGSSDTSTNVVQNVEVNNNLVQGYSRVFPDGEGIAQGNGFNNTYSNNDVSDGYHAGISICENDCPPVGVNGVNVLSSFNHIRNINQGITADGGSLYYNVGGPHGSATLDVISNNFIHDVTDSSIIDNPLGIAGSSQVMGSGYGGHGVYLDNQSADVNVNYNVVYNVSGSAAWMTGGPAQVSGWAPNKFNSNIFAYARLSMFAEGQPWPQVMTVSACPSSPTPLVDLSSNIFYFDLNESSNTTTNAIGFFVQGGCSYACNATNYNQFQDFTDNLYYRTDGMFGSDAKQFHVYKATFSNPSKCEPPASAGATSTAWTFIPFSDSGGSDSWQTGATPTLPLNVTEDVNGLIAATAPAFSATSSGCTSRAGAYCLSANPPGMTGFSYLQTNSTVTSAGSSLTAPAAVPATFPTYIYSIANSF
jgi:hypothetical protein